MVIASRLSEYFPTSSIALVEAGPNLVNDPDVIDPQGFSKLLEAGRIPDYSTTPQAHLNNRKISNLAGRFLSGSSGINVGVWLRASSTDFRIVAEKAGHKRFEFENLLPYFKRTETFWDENADPKYHGFNDAVHTVGGRKYPLREDVERSYERLGYKYNPDCMAGDPTGLCELTQSYIATSPSTSDRQHSGRTYDLSKVHPIRESPVARVLFDSSKRAMGVELVDGKGLVAREEVIVSCGTQKTPQLLMLSGIGPASELAVQGIPLIVNAPQVGQNLVDHSCIILYYKLKHPEKGLCFPFEGAMKPEYEQGLLWDWHVFGNILPSELSPLLKKHGEPGLADSAHPHLQSRRCHFMTIPHYLPVLGTPEYNPELYAMDGKHMAMTALHLLPISRGTITLKSANPKDEPVIDPKFMSTCTDRFILRHAVREVLKVTETPPFSQHLVGELPPADPKFPALTMKSSDEEIDARIRRFAQTIFHPMGTCALGSVLDDDFRVKGVSGLRVCDASVFPEPVGGMPQATVYAFGELCADLVARRC